MDSGSCGTSGFAQKIQKQEPSHAIIRGCHQKFCDALVVNFGRDDDPHLSMWEMAMLEHSGSMGDANNHQAVKVHYDCNNMHLLETIMLFGKLAENKHANHAAKVKKCIQDFWH